MGYSVLILDNERVLASIFRRATRSKTNICSAESSIRAREVCAAMKDGVNNHFYFLFCYLARFIS